MLSDGCFEWCYPDDMWLQKSLFFFFCHFLFERGIYLDLVFLDELFPYCSVLNGFKLS